MSNTLNPTNMITLDREPSVWQYPTTSDLDPANPATQARAEYEHSLYVDAIAQGEPEPVNQYETVPAANEAHGYATSSGEAMDPAHAEAVVAEAQAVVADAFAADPDMLAMHRANEAQRLSHERHNAAVAQAGAYGPQLTAMRNRALEDWGAGDQA